MPFKTMMGRKRSRCFSNRFSGAFLGTSAASLPFTDGKTEAQRYIETDLMSAERSVAELAPGAPEIPVVIPRLEICADARGLRS